MRRIKQRHITGCGPASLAMLTGISYQKALKLMLPDRQFGECACTNIFDNLRAFEDLELNVKVSLKKTSLRQLKQNAIIIVEMPQKKDHALQHAVVWDHEKKEVVDPWAWKSDFEIDEKFVKKHQVYRILLL